MMWRKVRRLVSKRVSKWVLAGLVVYILMSVSSRLDRRRQPLSNHNFTTDSVLDAIRPVRHPLFQLYSDDFPVSLTRDEGRQLTVHFVPFSHTDPGWLRSTEDYFHDVQAILDVVTDRLHREPDATFVWSEVIFLKMWWERASEDERRRLVSVVRSGQMEIVYPAMVMHDEAVTDLTSLINNLLSGTLWLRSTLNVTVKTAWSADPFGLSSTSAYLHTVFNVTNLLVQRANYLVKERLAQSRDLEFLWRQDWSESGPLILTSMNPFKLYAVPFNCGPEKRVCCMFDFWRGRGGCDGMYWPWETPHAPGYALDNWESSVRLLVQQYQLKASLFRTNHLLVLIGDDFRFSGHIAWSSQIGTYRRLIKYFSDQPELKVTAKFSNLSSYFDSIRSGNREGWSTITGDFLPYMDRWNEFWSGYFTTRPFLKLIGRRVLTALGVVSRLVSECELSTTCQHPDGVLESLEKLQQLSNNFNHHDYITGTARSYVVRKLMVQLRDGLSSLSEMFVQYAQLFARRLPSWPIDPESERAFLVSNLHPWPFRGFVHIELAHTLHGGDSFSLGSPSGNGGGGTHTEVKLLFVQEKTGKTKVAWIYIELEPFSSRTVVLKKSGTVIDEHFKEGRSLNAVGTPHHVFTLTSSGEVRSRLRSLPESGVKFRIGFDLFGTYTSAPLKYISNRSGAYVFLHDGSRNAMRGDSLRQGVTSEYLSRVSQSFGAVNYTMTFFKREGTVESQVVQLDVDFDIRHLTSVDLAMVLKTNLKSNSKFFADSNGLKPVERTYRAKFPLQGNTYPMSSYCQISDGEVWVSVISEHGHGVTSTRDGELVVFLDRTHPNDDWRGLNEGITDNQPGSASFWISISGDRGDVLWLAHHFNSKPSVVPLPEKSSKVPEGFQLEPKAAAASDFHCASRVVSSHFDVATNSSIIATQKMPPWNKSPFRNTDCDHNPQVLNHVPLTPPRADIFSINVYKFQSVVKP